MLRRQRDRDRACMGELDALEQEVVSLRRQRDRDRSRVAFYRAKIVGLLDRSECEQGCEQLFIGDDVEQSCCERAAGQDGDVNKAEEIFERMRFSRDLSDVATINSLTGGCAKHDDIKEAEEIFECESPGVATLNSLTVASMVMPKKLRRSSRG